MFIIVFFIDFYVYYFCFLRNRIFLASHLYANKGTSTKDLEQLQMKLSYNTINMQVPL